MTFLRLFIASLGVLLLAACSEQPESEEPQGVSGLWRLSSVSHFNGYLETFDEKALEQTLRLYADDGKCYEVKALADDSGIMVVPQEEIAYTLDCVDDTTFQYTENAEPYPFWRLSDSIIVTQKIGFHHKWIKQDADKELLEAVVRAFERDADGRSGGCQVISASEHNLKEENRTLQYVVALCLLLLAGAGLYVLTALLRRRRIMHLLRGIREELSQRPQQVSAALKRVEEDFVRSDYYIDLHRRITRGDSLSEDDWAEMERQVKAAYPDFVRHLLSLVTLSEVEFRTCMLIRLSVAPTNMAAVLHRDLSSISTIRSRLYKKVFGKKGGSRQWDDFVLSL